MLKEKLSHLPQKPGVYLFKDKDDKIIYIGKAINLKSRVSSYFQKSKNLEPAKEVMVKKIADLDYIVVDSEVEALLLESSLIKKHKPPFNVDLKDDKYFLYIKISLEEEWPRVFTVRRVNKDRNRYFGPFTSALAVKNTLRLIKRIFPYKICQNPPEKPCLGFHLGRCLGHKTENNTREDYLQIIQGVRRFLEGKNKNLTAWLKSEMEKASVKRKYEKAARFRDQIRAIELLSEKQKVVSPKLENQDVISLVRNHNQAAINLFQIREGKLLHREQFLLKNIFLQKDEDLLGSFLNQYYPQATYYPKEIILPLKINEQKSLIQLTKVKLLFPIKGRKKKLLLLGEKNAREFLRRRLTEEGNEELRSQQALTELATKLRLNGPLQRIEAYDVSNIQGENAVGSMVVFSNGRPDKTQYRKFKIKTVKGANDPAMMAEIIQRRFQKVKTVEKDSPLRQLADSGEAGRWPLPDLVILDGGKGQLGVVVKIMKKMGVGFILLIALAKQEEEIFLPGQKEPLRLLKDSFSLKLLRQIRDEAHRFAIGFYRKIHENKIVTSLLDEIPGIGPKTKKKLLLTFGSVQNIKEASGKDLEKVVGNNLTKKIKEYL